LLALGTLDVMNLDRFWVFDIDKELDEKYSSFLDHDIKRKYQFMLKDRIYPLDFSDAIRYLIDEKEMLHGK
jgi:hypothetical protein